MRGGRRDDTRGLRGYIHWLSRRLSGEALVSNAKCLLRVLAEELEEEKEEKIRRELPLLRREANRKRPPAQRAAEAVRLRSLKKLLKRARGEKLTRKERQALDIFTLAFATMSRVGEIAALEVGNVARDGGAIALRPKTSAKTWRRLVKRVSNAKGLRAADKLVRYREEARRRGRRCLFAGAKDRPVVTASVTRRLRKLGKRLGGGLRITAHSARKGAAVEAVLAGTPLPIVQALGGWANINTLQAYVGEAIRRTTSLADVLEGKGEVQRRMRRQKGTRGETLLKKKGDE